MKFVSQALVSRMTTEFSFVLVASAVSDVIGMECLRAQLL
jgi:hypothetical protein